MLPAHFFGFNAESIVLPVDDQLFANSPALHAKLAAVPTGILRIPGGTTSQWLNWRTGVFITGPGGPFNAVSPTRPAITMPHWAAIVRATGATPLWDLNVLNATISDQIAMLREAQRLGLPVRQVELGNELWNPTGPYPGRFPTGAAYGSAMNPWIVAVRRAFPRAVIAVSGADEAPSILSQVGGSRLRTLELQPPVDGPRRGCDRDPPLLGSPGQRDTRAAASPRPSPPAPTTGICSAARRSDVLP